MVTSFQSNLPWPGKVWALEQMLSGRLGFVQKTNVWTHHDFFWDVFWQVSPWDWILNVHNQAKQLVSNTGSVRDQLQPCGQSCHPTWRLGPGSSSYENTSAAQMHCILFSWSQLSAVKAERSDLASSGWFCLAAYGEGVKRQQKANCGCFTLSVSDIPRTHDVRCLAFISQTRILLF